MSDRQSTVVTVTIAGEQYTLRAHASPEYTRQCAEYLDEVIREVRQQVGGLDPQRVAILAGLALADQLLQERKDNTQLRASLVESVVRLNAEIEMRRASTDLAAPS